MYYETKYYFNGGSCCRRARRLLEKIGKRRRCIGCGLETGKRRNGYRRIQSRKRHGYGSAHPVFRCRKICRQNAHRHEQRRRRRKNRVYDARHFKARRLHDRLYQSADIQFAFHPAEQPLYERFDRSDLQSPVRTLGRRRT